MVFVSVVVPVFNGEATITRCINSVLSQSIENVEVIVVDDCSTDCTGEIVTELVALDSRIIYLRNEVNSSALLSRKRGVNYSSGRYVMFLDADDQLQPNACAEAIKAMEDEGVDVCQFRTVISESGATPGQISWFNEFVNKHPEGRVVGNLVDACFVKKSFGFTLWNKIYRAEVVKVAFSKIPDVQVFKAQDLLIEFFILFYSKSYAFVDRELYIYNYGSGITGGGQFNELKIRVHMSQACVVSIIFDFLSKNGLAEIYDSAVAAIAEDLIKDNLATLKKCAQGRLGTYAKQLFSQNWFKEEWLCCGATSHIKQLALMRSIFEKFTVDKVFSDIYKEEFSKVSVLPSSAKNSSINPLPIVMATNEKYAPYLSVAVESIKATSRHLVDIFVFYTSLSLRTIRKLESLSSDQVKVVTVNVSRYICSADLYAKAHYSVEMYYRLVIADIFRGHAKVLYIDCDVVVLGDLRDLFETDVEGYVLGAARNPIHKGMHNYLTQKLMFSPTKYFNSGVLLINVQEFIGLGVKDKCLRFLEDNSDLACPDQDALNVVCEDKVLYLDQKWNYQWHHSLIVDGKPLMTPLLDYEKQEYFEAASNKKLIHFTSNIKPWSHPDLPLSEFFWEYCSGAPFLISRPV